MLDLLGSGYVIEHCVAAFLQRRRREIFEDYIADCANLAASLSGQHFTKSLHDMRHAKQEPEDKRSPKEIMDERIKKYGITVVSA